MPKSASDVLVETVVSWGVTVIFGLPGDGINGVMEAIRTRQDKVRFIQVRHEESAALMACGYSKWTGRLGCCLATTGPGGIHLLNGLYDAKADGAPVLAITGLPYHDLTNTHTQQDVDHSKLFMDVARYSGTIMSAAQVENVVSLACRTALAERGVAHVAIPTDIQEQALDDADRSPRNAEHHVSMAKAEAVRLPPDADLDRAEILNCGRRVAILAGRGALGARQELIEVAEKLGQRCYSIPPHRMNLVPTIRPITSQRRERAGNLSIPARIRQVSASSWASNFSFRPRVFAEHHTGVCSHPAQCRDAAMTSLGYS